VILICVCGIILSLMEKLGGSSGGWIDAGRSCQASGKASVLHIKGRIRGEAGRCG